MTVHKQSIAALASAGLLLSGCASIGLTEARAGRVSAATQLEAQTVALQCPADSVEKELFVATALPAIVGLAADFAVNYTQAALERAQRNRNAAWAASGTTACFPISDPTTSKVRIAREIVTGSVADRISFDRSCPDRAVQPNTPAFELIGQLTFTPSGSGDDAKLSVTFQAECLVYGRRAPLSEGSGRKHVTVYLVFSEAPILAQGDLTEDDLIQGAMRLDFGRLADGRYYQRPLIDHVNSAMALPVPSSANMVMTAIVFENDDPSLALDAFTEAFENNSDDLADIISGLAEREDDD